mmetsp:Transcript_399/g.764  ORF Transcript_399/g.764 Transcript_399/m.764 type:complete len:442 (-) Transcript_399:182-1507(-)|eukprot:CAMPEP_0201657760 /NCGR_PEP_ID=MMETSP0494-20130426/889_1 /ASSEMBLY_ACC=CAM_ASM_000839 /TAXON_ID=420259 /ORGANISM="Thalassiosira gravida, Strain GMp14c1" /LENGTH=441 /DNA_ID=CAMNT_0048134657 /DNA_START=264 /DNA_END=1589 /DNA_ORIENTATION=-
MVSSLSKSIALASALYTSLPASLAFTTPSLQRGSPSHSFSTSLFNDASAAGEESNSRRPQRPPFASSQQEEQLNSQHNDIELPLPTASNPFGLDNDNAILNNSDEQPRSSEFHNLEPRHSSPARLSRLNSEVRSQNVYIPSGSDQYWGLRDEIAQLEQDLQNALELDLDDGALDSIKSMLRRAQAKDPSHVYNVIGEAAMSAEERGDVEASEKYREESKRARSMLPQFNLEGLWVGKYGSHGFEMINVTYSGDTLVAYKVTGDQNIPRGEISFTADLSPSNADFDNSNYNQQSSKQLEPIQLSESSAKKWGTKRLPRFVGQGHAAEPGYINNQFMEGQLVVIGGGDYFSFAWVPLEHQIFFGRPSPELTLKMLKEGGKSSLTAGVGLEVPGLEAGRKEQTEYVSRCLEVTEDTLWDELNEGKVDPFSCIWHGDDADYCYFE